MPKTITLDDISKITKRINVVSILAEDSTFEGVVKSVGVLNISGTAKADITGNVLNILENGMVSGTISSIYTKIAGKFDGHITSGVIHVTKFGHIKGDINYGILVVEDGGSVEGVLTQKKELLTTSDD